MAQHLDGELRIAERAVLSRSRVRPWKLQMEKGTDALYQPIERTKLTVFGESRSRLFAVHRDNFSAEVLPRSVSGQRQSWGWSRPASVSRYKLSQFLCEIAPTWADPAPSAAIIVTDHGAADWILVDREHVAAGWEKRPPTIEQVALSITTLLRITKPPPSPVPFR